MLFVWNAVPKFGCLNKFVMYLFSLPVYVKVSHLCSFLGDRSGECRLGVCCM